MIQADPSGRFVLHIDLGLDRIFVWKFDERSGVLTPNEPPGVSLPPGDGPRHFCFHPNGRWCYSLQEEGSNIVLFDYDAAKGRLTSRQTISSLPPGFAGSNFCSEILVSADGRFVYAGNRLHDSIGIFSVGNTWGAGLRRRGMDTGKLSAQLQFRSHRPVPLLLQPAGRQRGGVPRRSQDGPAELYWPLHPDRESLESSCSSTSQEPDNATWIGYFSLESGMGSSGLGGSGGGPGSKFAIYLTPVANGQEMDDAGRGIECVDDTHDLWTRGRRSKGVS